MNTNLDKKLLSLEATRSCPSKFAQEIMNGRFMYPDHIHLLEKYLLQTFHGEITKLAISMPPRHGKTLFTTKTFPAWWLGHRPNDEIMLIAYAESHADDYGKAVKDIINGWGKSIFGIELDSSSKANGRFHIAGHRGSLLATGMEGPITGKGANLMIIDDPIKGPEMNTKTYRDKIWNWYVATSRTRLEPRSVQIVMMTRWHEDDLIGRIKAYEPKGWVFLNLPALAEENDMLGRKEGEALWPEKFTVKKLQEDRELNRYWFRALYQGRPQALSGGIFKQANFIYYKELSNAYEYYNRDGKKVIVSKNSCKIYQTVDLAISTKDIADYTVIATFAVTPESDIFILDVTRGRFETTDHVQLCLSTFFKYRPVAVGVEAVQYQKALVNELKKKGLPVRAIKPDKDKVTRAMPLAAHYSSGKIFHPANAPWLADFEDELMAFPAGAHDDQVDALSHMGFWLPTLSYKGMGGFLRGNTETVNKKHNKLLMNFPVQNFNHKSGKIL